MRTAKLNGRFTFFAFVFVVTAFAFGPPAHAISITSSVGVYEVTTVRGTGTSLETLLRDQIWWGDPTLAEEFALKVGGQLGFGNPFGTGPYFAYGFRSIPPTTRTRDVSICAPRRSPPPVICNDSFTLEIQPRIYAVGSQVPEPTTMLLFTTGLLGLSGYRWHQRRRERTQVE